jgi:hypothetical protein
MKKPLEGSIKEVKIGENRNKIQDIAMFHNSGHWFISTAAHKEPEKI